MARSTVVMTVLVLVWPMCDATLQIEPSTHAKYDCKVCASDCGDEPDYKCCKYCQMCCGLMKSTQLNHTTTSWVITDTYYNILEPGGSQCSGTPMGDTSTYQNDTCVPDGYLSFTIVDPNAGTYFYNVWQNSKTCQGKPDIHRLQHQGCDGDGHLYKIVQKNTSISTAQTPL